MIFKALKSDRSVYKKYKILELLYLRLAILTNQLSFLLRCRKYQILPQKIRSKLSTNGVKMSSFALYRKLERIIVNYGLKLVAIEIKDAYAQIARVKKRIVEERREFINLSDKLLVLAGLCLVDDFYVRKFDLEKARLKNKFEMMFHKDKMKLGKKRSGTGENARVFESVDLVVL